MTETSTNNLALVGCGWGDYAQQQVPDIVGNLRVDQAWGSAQVSGALHQVRANFYGDNFSAASPGSQRMPQKLDVQRVKCHINSSCAPVCMKRCMDSRSSQTVRVKNSVGVLTPLA